MTIKDFPIFPLIITVLRVPFVIILMIVEILYCI